MLTLLLILLAATDVTVSLLCITNCSLTNIPFGEDLRIRAGQCQQRATLSVCTVDMTLDFHKMQYSAIFGGSPKDAETIYISAGLPLDYDFSQQCSTETDCVVRDAQKRIDELTRRSYNATVVYGEIAPIITSALAGDQIKCFDANSNVVTCASGEICSIVYDQIARRVTSRGCVSIGFLRVFVYDSPTSASFDIRCKRDLCNGDLTYYRIKDILNKYNLVYANGRILGSAGSRTVISSLSILLCVTLAFLLSS